MLSGYKDFCLLADGLDVEHRREPRFKPHQPARVKVLGLSPTWEIQATTLDISGSGMGLRSDLPLPCGAPVEIETNGTVSHGTVCRCEPDDGCYEVGIQVTEIAPVLKS
jgi:PilZ domain-containing protein